LSGISSRIVDRKELTSELHLAAKERKEPPHVRKSLTSCFLLVRKP
jgi:hypothetical protein